MNFDKPSLVLIVLVALTLLLLPRSSWRHMFGNSPWISDAKYFLGEKLRSPWLAGLNTLFGVLAGVMAAAFHDDLNRSAPVIWFSDSVDSLPFFCNKPVVFFWLFTGIFSFVWAAREWLHSKDRRQEHHELLHRIDTTPPPDFLKDYNREYKNIFHYTRKISDDSTSIDLMTDIRWVLDVVIQLAARWDYETGSTESHYRANIMVDIGKVIALSPEQKLAGERLLGEAGFEAALANADGALWVDKRFATGQEVDGAEDAEVEPLLLLYSQKNKINLYGAPEAFIRQDSRYIADTNEILTAFPRGLVAESKDTAEALYKGDNKARSIISLPLPGADKLVGVLNIYRDSPNIMGSRSRATNFGFLMTPLAVKIGNLVEKLNNRSLHLQGD